MVPDGTRCSARLFPGMSLAYIPQVQIAVTNRSGDHASFDERAFGRGQQGAGPGFRDLLRGQAGAGPVCPATPGRDRDRSGGFAAPRTLFLRTFAGCRPPAWLFPLATGPGRREPVGGR